MLFYPRARHQHHPSIRDPTVRSLRRGLLKAAFANLIFLQILFLGIFCYVYGSLFQQTARVHNLTVLFVDYDGGAVGNAFRAAYQQLESAAFPTLIEQATSAYPDRHTIESAVCQIEYWGALYIASNASSRLAAAFAGGSAATVYNSSEVVTLVWNEARYATIIDSTIFTNVQSLSEQARIVYSRTDGAQALQSLNRTDPEAIAAFSAPWALQSANIQPTTQGSRLIYNTLVIILIMIQEFIYLGYINGLYQRFRLYVTVAPHRIAIYRQLISGFYTFIGSLCTTGAIWAFRYGWDVDNNQLVLTWMVLWLFAHLNFLVLDAFTIWITPPFVPVALICWLMLNVCSVLLPFDLAPGFYKWGFALPTHAVFQVLVDIWSGGCNPQLDYGLPVLFVYELLGLAVSTVGVYRRAHYAVIAKETEEMKLQGLIATAIREQSEEKAAEEKPPRERSAGMDSVEVSQGEDGGIEALATSRTLSNEEELGDRIWREMSKIEQKATRQQNAGPCFDLPFSE